MKSNSINVPHGFKPTGETEKLEKAVANFNDRIRLKTDTRATAQRLIRQYRAKKENL